MSSSPLPASADRDVARRSAARPAPSSPLHIIAMFIAVSEAAASAAAIGTGGSARLILTVFAVAFPVLVLAVFVWLLVRYPAHLYAPSQFTADASLEAFVRAFKRQSDANQVVLRAAVGQAVATGVAPQIGPPASTEAVREQVESVFQQAVSAGSVTVVRSEVLPNAEPVQIPVSPQTRVQDLLDSVYFGLVPAVGVYTYGSEWVLARGDGRVLGDLGKDWAQRHGTKADDRLLSQVGIVPGSTLTALPADRPPVLTGAGPA